MNTKGDEFTEDVALLAEGVDRNDLSFLPLPSRQVALLAEGVDRNKVGEKWDIDELGSPSSRRAWIEILIRERTADISQGRPPRGGRG